MSFFPGPGPSRLPGLSLATSRLGASLSFIARTASDSDSSNDETSEVDENGQNAIGSAMNVGEDDGAVDVYNRNTPGSSSPTNINTINYASEEDSSEYKRPAQRRKATKTAQKKGKKKSKFMPNEKSKKASSMSTFKNKLGIIGMESFLRRPEFGLDVDNEFPLKGKTEKTFYDSSNNPISRADALAYKCHDLHQILIDATTARLAEEASRDEKAKQLMGGVRLDLGGDGTWAMASDTHQTMLARIDLQTIRDRASIQINAAYDNNVEPAAELTEIELGSDNQPIISAAVQSLVYKAVDAQIRYNKLRTLHVSESGDLRFQIPAEYAQLRAKLNYELQNALRLEDNVDGTVIAQMLVVQEFPPQL